jgi:SusD family.
MMSFSGKIMRALGLAAVLIPAGITGCDFNKALSVQPANLIDAVALESSPQNALLLVNGAASDFDCAYNSYVVVGGLIGEELDDAIQTADRWPYDQRTVSANQSRYSQNSCTGLGVYTPLQAARVSANNVRRLLEGWTDVQVPGRQLLIARVTAYEAWSQLLLGEAFCETVFSTVDGEQVNYGTRITREQALDSAIARFSDAIAASPAGSGPVADSLRYFSLIGRAKAYQDRGNLASARADAVLVPASFVWNITASNTNSRRQNRVFQENNAGSTPSSSIGIRYRAATYTSDPRIKIANTGKFSNSTNVPLWVQSKYPAVNSPIPMATGTEMQLLIAEADRTSNRANTLAIIATMRAAGNQPAYTGTTADDDLNEIIDQRRRALFLTGTHFGDLIRYNLTLTPAAGTGTPWNQQYGPDKGSQLCLPLPQAELLNNPLAG